MLTPEQKTSLTRLLPSKNIITEPALLTVYEYDGSVYRGQPDGAVLLGSIQEAQQLTAWSLENKIPLIGRGSGTGLTGGSVAPVGGVVVAFNRMNQMLALDPDSMQVTVQPGIITQRLQNQTAAQGLYYPPDPASNAVCTIGGNIAENAGGPHCLKYGITRHYVQALQVALVGGELLWLGSSVLDPPEYDFVSLFTGSEGTLGLILSAVLRLRPLPKAVKALTASFASVEIASRAVSAIISAGLLPATIELMDQFMIQIVEEYLHAGFPTQAGAMLIFDVDGYPESLDVQLDEIVQIITRFQPIEIKIARSAEERESLWLGRRSSSGAMSRLSPSHYGVDICVPCSRLAEAMRSINALGEQHGLQIAYLAHAGDGNVHPLVLCNLEDPAQAELVHQLSDDILNTVAKMGGTIGGEHGTGIEKRHSLSNMYSRAEIEAMLEVKSVFDPHGLMNPSLIFPEQLPARDEPTLRAQSLEDEAFYPTSAEEAAAALNQLHFEKRQVSIAGVGSQWRGETTDYLVSTRFLDRILALNRDDFYVHVQPGLLLADLESELAALGFRLPLASPWQGSLGGLVSANLGSPQRGLHGWVRDVLLCAQVALPDGRLLRFGRPLVKDVAGYDMARLFCGAYGTLGMLTELHLKIIAAPKARRLLSLSVESFRQAIEIARQARPVASLSAGMLIQPGSAGEWWFSLGLEGHPADVAAEINLLKRTIPSLGSHALEEIPDSSVVDLWRKALAPAVLAARLAALPQRLFELDDVLDHNTLDHLVIIDYASGTVYFSLPPDQAKLESANALLSALHIAGEALGGHAAWLAGPRLWLRQVNAWGAQRPALPLMRRLKATWDPANLLNRGEFCV
jgi:D-lactate dehydrogenase (cytochrome)